MTQAPRSGPPRAAEDHHRIKTFAGWEAKQPFPGIYIGRDPFGAYYLVDHTGTRRLGTAGEAA